MGSSISKEQRTNFNTLLSALDLKNISNIQGVIENSTTSYDFYYNSLTLYHYLVLEAVYFTRIDLLELCEIIYKNRNKFGDCNKKIKDKLYIIYEKYFIH